MLRILSKKGKWDCKTRQYDLRIPDYLDIEGELNSSFKEDRIEDRLDEIRARFCSLVNILTQKKLIDAEELGILMGIDSWELKIKAPKIVEVED